MTSQQKYPPLYYEIRSKVQAFEKYMGENGYSVSEEGEIQREDGELASLFVVNYFSRYLSYLEQMEQIKEDNFRLDDSE